MIIIKVNTIHIIKIKKIIIKNLMKKVDKIDIIKKMIIIITTTKKIVISIIDTNLIMALRIKEIKIKIIMSIQGLIIVIRIKIKAIKTKIIIKTIL